MQKYRVEITRTAENDARETYDYIRRDNKAAAIKWLGEIERQIETLANFPVRCPVIPEASELGREYRHLIHGRYRTVFRIEGMRVIILRIINSARLLDQGLFGK